MTRSARCQSSNSMRFVDLAPDRETFEHAVLTGLSNRPKRISPKFFYDQRGSELFEEICRLEEYYPTRTELGILGRHATEIAALIGPRAQLVEFGAGAQDKVRLILDSLDDPAGYAPIDISGDHLREAAGALKSELPDLDIVAIAADYSRPIRVPIPHDLPDGKVIRAGFFPGSTIGNFSPDDARAFLANASKLLGEGGILIVGVDLKKNPAMLHAAYNDSRGITAAFNLNLLERINRELDGTIPVDEFSHVAFYNEREGRIEMHLKSRCAQTVRVAGSNVEFHRDETIHTENSYKYSVEEFREVATEGGFDPVEVWTDKDSLFSVHALKARSE